MLKHPGTATRGFHLAFDPRLQYTCIFLKLSLGKKLCGIQKVVPPFTLFDMIFLPCLFVNHGFSSRRHLAYERMSWRFILSIYTKRHVGSPVVVPLHKQIHGITLTHHDGLKLWQLTLNLAVQSLKLAVGLWMPDTCKDLLYSKLY